MTTLAQLQDWRGRLQDARYSGTRAVQDSNGERIEYKSDSEMARAMASLDSEIAAATSRPPSTIIFRTSKGL